MGRGPPLTRRRALAATLALPWLAGCAPAAAPTLPPVRWVGASADRGHRLREAPPAGDRLARRADVVIVGAGIAGLGAARALQAAGIDDIALLELEDEAGGNSRGHVMGGMACPLGAHYLPLPGPHAIEVTALLDELGLRRHEGGRVVYDERHLCHAPQERLWLDGAWHEGLLPPTDALPESQRAAARDDYRRFAALVAEAGAGEAFRMPSARAPWTPALAALDGQTFADWLDAQSLRSPALRWYLDYCCRDDYGAGSTMVSAWAGLHYFASRHGFHAPDEGPADDGGVLTWPEGNAWLARRLAAPFAQRLHTGRVALRVDEGRHAVSVDVWDAGQGRLERWAARAVVLAVPLFVAQRMLATPPAALPTANAALVHAPWLVANLQLHTPLLARTGTPAAWDSVRYGTDDLGYVDAMHQGTRPHAGPTVLTGYRALGGGSVAALAAGRQALLTQSAAAWAQRVLDSLLPMHPDLPRRVAAIDLMRYGHAMAIPRPGVRGSAALGALSRGGGRVCFAHADLAGSSVFEEALFHGHAAGGAVASRLRRPAAP